MYTLTSEHTNGMGAVVIDHWRKFGGAQDFKANTAWHLAGQPGGRRGSNVTVIDADCWTVSAGAMVAAGAGGLFDVYFYDADHSERSHYRAIVHAFDALAETSVVVIDDW
jgi:hypothetical protein